MPSLFSHRISMFPPGRTPGGWPPRDFVPPHDGWSSLASFLRDFAVEDAAGDLRVRLALPGHQAQDIQVRIEGQVLTVHATCRRMHAIPVRVWRNETARPRRSLDLGTFTTREERRPGWWQRVKEWLMGRRHSEV